MTSPLSGAPQAKSSYYVALDGLRAAALMECSHPGSFLGSALSWKPLRALGIVSYGFYVYHDLLYDFYAHFAHWFSPAFAYPMTLLVAFSVTAVIATASYQVIEKPLPKLKDRFTGQVHTAPKHSLKVQGIDVTIFTHSANSMSTLKIIKQRETTQFFVSLPEDDFGKWMSNAPTFALLAS